MSISAEGDKAILAKETPASSENTVQTPQMSIWFQPAPSPAKIPGQSPVVRRLVTTPIRSISTFSFAANRDHVYSAAPFPSLPTKQEVLSEKNEIEAEIQRAKAELASLKYERNSLSHPSRTLIPGKRSANGIHEYRGLVIEDHAISDVIQENKQKSQEAQIDALVKPSDKEKSDVKHILPKFRHIVDLPEYKKTIENEKDILVPLFATRFAEKEILMEKEEELTEQYNEFTEEFKKREKIIDEYNARTGEKSENWPPEFYFERPDLDDQARLKWAAQDIPMILSKSEQIDRCYYDTNSYVRDPKKEFDQYRTRLAWTEEEKHTFVEKYRQHPKDFEKIAEALPQKTIKEVIEFYYLNRYKMNLKDNEGVAKRRGGKKKVVTEGTKKNY